MGSVSKVNGCGKYRNICFALNNYTEENYKKLLNNDLFKYVIIGKETGERGTPHLQGYAELKKQMRLKAIMREIHPTHVEARFCSQEEANIYCKKENSWVEKGNKRHQGERNDLKEILNAVKSGISRSELNESGLLNCSFHLAYANSCCKFCSPKKEKAQKLFGSMIPLAQEKPL
jgi:hypothetical protein